MKYDYCLECNDDLEGEQKDNGLCDECQECFEEDIEDQTDEITVQ